MYFIQMISFDNVFDDDELCDWQEKFVCLLGFLFDIDDFIFIGELKIDGLSVNFYYFDGELQWVVMCGNGWVGEIVMVQVLIIFDIFQKFEGLKGEFEVCGEVYLLCVDFVVFNVQVEEFGMLLLKNFCNGVVGVLW